MPATPLELGWCTVHSTPSALLSAKSDRLTGLSGLKAVKVIGMECWNRIQEWYTGMTFDLITTKMMTS